MSDHELQTLMRAAAAQVDPPDAPVDQIIACGRRQRRRVLAAGAAAVLAVAATPAAWMVSHDPGVSRVQPAAPASYDDRLTALEQAAHDLDSVGGRDADHYSSSHLDIASNRITVYLAGSPGSWPRDRYTAVVPGWVDLRFHPAKLTAVQVRRLFEVWAADAGSLARRGVRSTCAQADPDGGAFQVCVSGNRTPSPKLLKPFLIFGPGTATFIRQEVLAPARPGAGVCTSADLQLGLGERISAMTGEAAVMFTLTNASGAACQLLGYPRVTLRDSAGHDLPFSYTQGRSQYVTGHPPTAVVLSPGGTAYFLVAKYRCDSGDRGVATQASITPPGNRDDLTGPATSPDTAPLSYCNGGKRDPGQRIAVSPIVSTPTGALP